MCFLLANQPTSPFRRHDCGRSPGGPFPSPSVTVVSAVTADAASTKATAARQSQFERLVAEGLDPGGVSDRDLRGCEKALMAILSIGKRWEKDV